MPADLWMWIGFIIAGVSVMWNDSIQTLGTFISSNAKKLSWRTLWIGASTVLILVIWIGWVVNDGDMAYGRLTRYPEVEIEWYHAMAPLVLLALTWVGIPVSTSFLVLAVFSTSDVFGGMFEKSAMGLGVGAVVSLILWHLISWVVRLTGIDFKNLSRRWETAARIAQACSTAFLWSTWLMHDVANIAVYLPRQVPWPMLLAATAVLVIALRYIFAWNGGRIQHMVKTKRNTRFVVSATVIDFVYAAVLLYFKELNSLPMSTTWVFVGVLLGRQVAVHHVLPDKRERKVIPMVIADLSKLLFGALVSVIMALVVRGQLQNAFNWIEGLGIARGTALVVAACLLTYGMVWANQIHHREHSELERGEQRSEG